MDHPMIEMALRTGYPTKAHSDWEIEQERKDREEEEEDNGSQNT